jgi:tRNA modification GTPase
VIEESIDLDGILVRVIDTAGIRETGDAIEQEGIRRTQAARVHADLILVILDGHSQLTEADHQILQSLSESRYLILVNKSDLTQKIELTVLPSDAKIFQVSAKTGQGIEQLKAAMKTQLVSPGFETDESLMVTNVRHRTALSRAQGSLANASASVQGRLAAEIVAVDLRAAADALGEITGAITTDDILEKIFSQFCIGK